LCNQVLGGAFLEGRTLPSTKAFGRRKIGYEGNCCYLVRKLMVMAKMIMAPITRYESGLAKFSVKNIL